MSADLKARGMAQASKPEMGFIIGDSTATPPFLPISIDTTGKTVSIYYLFTLYSRKGKFTVPAVGPYVKSYTGSSDDIIMIYFDLTDLVWKVANITTSAAPTNIIPISYFNGAGYFHGNAHAIRYNGAPALEQPYYDWDISNAFVMPNNFYFVKDYTYSIASQNFNKLVTYNNPNLLYEIFTDQYIDRFVNSCRLNFKTIEAFATTLTGIKGQNFKNALRKDLTINVTGTTKTNTTPKILCMGDSITHRYFIDYIKKWLVSMGITPTFIGTMQNQASTGYILGEGRSGWRSTDFTGVCTHDGSPLPASDAVNSVLTNPFLNGGVFDFSHYMSAQGFVGVDYVVLMMGTNDVTNYSVQGVAPTVSDATIPLNVRDSLNTIITSIHAYNPNIKIAVLPPILGGMWLDKTYEFLAVAERLIYTFDVVGVANVNLVASYLTSGLMAAKVQTAGTAFSVLNNTIKSPLSNDVHDQTTAASMNALWAASWIMNMLT